MKYKQKEFTMSPRTADELIALACDVEVSDSEFCDAFLHFVPDSSDGYERLVYTIALHRATCYYSLGIDAGVVERTLAVLAQVRTHLRKNAS